MSEVFIFVAGMIAPAFVSAVLTLFKCFEDVIRSKVKWHQSKACGVDFVMQPDLVRTAQYAAISAGWYWATHNCNQIAESGDWLALTKRINGGTIGYEDRVKHTNHALEVLG